MNDELDFTSLSAWDLAFEQVTGYLPEGSPVTTARTQAKAMQEILVAQQRGMMNAHPAYALNQQQQLRNNPSAALGIGSPLGGVLRGLGLGNLLR